VYCEINESKFCYSSSNFNFIIVFSAVGAGDAGNAIAAASPSKRFLGKFGQIWIKLKRNLGKIEAKFGQKLIEFGQIDWIWAN